MFGLIPFKVNKGVNSAMSPFNDFLEDFFEDDMGFPFANNEAIKADVRETNEAFLMQVELPGVKKEDIKLDYNDKYLTVSALRNEVKEDKNNNYIRKERHYGEISRSFYFDNINKDNIQARFQNGVLEIILPKVEKVMNDNNRIKIQ